MKKIFIALTFGILFFSLLSFASASIPLSGLLQDNVSNLIITIHQNSSQADLYLNTSGQPWDSQTVIFNGTLNENGVIIGPFHQGFNISTTLDSVDGQVELVENSNIPVFTSLNLHPQSPWDILLPYGLEAENLTIDQINNDCLTNNCSIINGYFQANPLPINSSRTIVFTKQGDNYEIWNDKGYGDIDDYKQNIRDIISQNLIQMNVSDIISTIFPILANDFKYDGNISVSQPLLSLLNDNYSIYIGNLSSVQLQDGNYTVPVTISNETTNFTKNIYLILQGIQNSDFNDTIINGTFIPTNPEVLKYINYINGTDGGINVTLQDIYDSTLPSDTNKVIKYILIDVGNESNGSIGFQVPVSDIVNPNEVNLWVLENGTWNELPTTYLSTIGSNYEFYALTNHFSTFMIMESITPVVNNGNSDSGGGSGSGSSSSSGSSSYIPLVVSAPIIINNSTNQTQPIQANPLSNPKNSNWIFFIILIIFIVSIIVLIIFYWTLSNVNERSELK